MSRLIARSSGGPAVRRVLEAGEQGRELRERQGVGAVGERGGGIVVSLEEDAVDTGGYAGARQRLDEFGLAAAGVALAAGELHGVGHVEDDGIAEFSAGSGNERMSTTRFW